MDEFLAWQGLLFYRVRNGYVYWKNGVQTSLLSSRASQLPIWPLDEGHLVTGGEEGLFTVNRFGDVEQIDDDHVLGIATIGNSAAYWTQHDSTRQELKYYSFVGAEPKTLMLPRHIRGVSNLENRLLVETESEQGKLEYWEVFDGNVRRLRDPGWPHC